VTLSPGLANACFDLLSLADRRALSFSEIRDAFGEIGVVSTKEAIQAAQDMRWLRASDSGIAVLTPSGARLLSLGAAEPRLRQAILDYIDVEEPFWLQDAAFGRKRLLAFVAPEIAQLFLEAGLVHGTGAEVVGFWDSLAARARGQKDNRLSAIGREGERLTIAFEEERTGRAPKWVAIDNNADGYDVLSVVNRADARQLSIEVKTTNAGPYGKFHLTRNEWDRAVEAPAHAFYLWDIHSKPPRIAILSPEDIEPHICSDRGDGEWELLSVPFDAFTGRFHSPHAANSQGST
jgi:hypothetical protein